jgi:hypothetical protein
MLKDNPSGARMVLREQRTRDFVEEVLIAYPQTKGDDRQLRQRVDWLIANRRGLRIGWTKFQVLRSLPSPDTICRRRRDLQKEQRDRVRIIIAAKHPEYCKDELDNALNEALNGDLKDFGEEHNIQPTERTRNKRARKEEAERHAFGKGLTLNDWTNGEDFEGYR